MKVILSVTEGPHRGKVFEFSEHDTFIVGRSADAHFRLPVKDKTISRFHFLIEINPPCCRLMDMASTNGTFVNGREVPSADLKDGDTIVGGRTGFVVAIREREISGSQTIDDSWLPGAPRTPRDSLSTRLPEGSSTLSIPRYRVGRELGRGGMGVVHLAHTEVDETPVAIKTIVPMVAASEAALARFLREAGILRRLDHPNIVKFLEIGQSEGRFYFAMEYVPGVDAAEILSRHGGPLPVGRAVGLACQILDALAYSHGLGFVHRDIKPNNVIVATQDGRDAVKLADFGLARTYQTSPMSGLTLSGQFGGAAGFLAPEQITNFRDVKPASDLYATGATLYYLLTSKKTHDFQGGFESQLLAVLQEEPIPIRDRRPDIPGPLADAIHRALARNPEDRFPDALAMRSALMPFGKAR
jgi:serine/threonine-protein kinase